MLGTICSLGCEMVQGSRADRPGTSGLELMGLGLRVLKGLQGFIGVLRSRLWGSGLGGRVAEVSELKV